VRSRLLKTTVLTAVAGAIVTQMPQPTMRLNIGRRLSLKCLFIGHEDWIRRSSDRVYLKCFECGWETRGWTTGRSHQSDRAAAGRVQREPVNKRDDHSASILVRSPQRRSLRSDRSIGDHRDMTIVGVAAGSGVFNGGPASIP
jgi:hypothetical protein